MSTDTPTWRPFDIDECEYPEPDHNGVRVLNLARGDEDRRASWLGCALAGLGVLALAAAAVSFTAQYRRRRRQAPAGHCRPRSRDTGRRGGDLRKPRYRPGTERQARDPGPGP